LSPIDSHISARGNPQPAIKDQRTERPCASDEGGHRAAITYKLIETARLNDVDPEAWLADVIARIVDHPISKLDELLPFDMGESRPERHCRIASRGHPITLTLRRKCDLDHG
jgi:IS66 C-terminal element